MPTIPSLSISPEKVFFVISKARQSEIGSDEPELMADFADDDAGYGPRSRGGATGRSELASFIRGLNVDEQVDMVALMWLGRGDGEIGNWRDLRAQAAQAHNNRTAAYLIGTPMLADYLEEAMDAFGVSAEDFEESL
jgi:hypothetical protein